jgi:hypothetical protein
VYSSQLRFDAQGLLLTSNEQRLIPQWDSLHYECFESVHKHPFAGRFEHSVLLRKLLSFTTGLIWARTSNLG